jgi:8-oxo-dGTP diphosphatase
MHCYLCSIASGEIKLREHKFTRWLIAETLDIVEWLPANKEIVDKLNNRSQSYK